MHSRHIAVSDGGESHKAEIDKPGRQRAFLSSRFLKRTSAANLPVNVIGPPTRPKRPSQKRVRKSSIRLFSSRKWLGKAGGGSTPHVAERHRTNVPIEHFHYQYALSPSARN